MTENIKKLDQILFKTFRSDSKAEEILESLDKMLEGIERTYDLYQNFAMYCSNVLIQTLPNVEALTIHQIRCISYAMACIINWGIYPHLPKSIQMEFNDDPHWVYDNAPPRLYRPQNICLQSLRVFLNSPCTSDLYSLFLHHCLSIFYFIEPHEIHDLCKTQPTGILFTSIMYLVTYKIRVEKLLVELVIDRSDSFEAIESTMFPSHIVAKAIAAPPSKESSDDYYQMLIPRLFEALRTGKGAVLARFTIEKIIVSKPDVFLKYFDLSPLLDWPTKDPIGSIVLTLDRFLNKLTVHNVLLPPIPHRLLFLASQLDGVLRDKCIRMVKLYIGNLYDCTEFLNSILSDSTLSTLSLDGFVIVSNDKGVYIEIIQDQDELEILEEMRSLLSQCFDTKFFKDIVMTLPPTFGSVQFLSCVLPEIKSFDSELAVSILTFLSTIKEQKDAPFDLPSIAKTIFENTTNLKSIPSCVIDRFGYDVPELRALSVIQRDNSQTHFDFDPKKLIDEITSSIPAIKGKGLFELRKGVMQNDHPLRELKNIEVLLPIINKQLSDRDSFVYLGAIRAMEAIADVYPDLVIEKLSEQFPHKEIGTSLTISQVLMVCARRTGPGLVHSKKGNLCGYFIKAFARGTSHESSLIHASSISSLATFVENLSYGIGPWLTDIVVTIDSSWQSHKAIEIRRAASYLCVKLIESIGEGFSETSYNDIKLLANCVKRNREGEFDEVSHSNAELSYQILWDNAPSVL